LNESLLGDKRAWEARVTQAEATIADREREIAEMTEQARDMMAHLEARERVDEEGGAGGGGDILGVGPSPRAKLASRIRRGRRC
jgi:multidrug resistance efflux pump